MEYYNEHREKTASEFSVNRFVFSAANWTLRI